MRFSVCKLYLNLKVFLKKPNREKPLCRSYGGWESGRWTHGSQDTTVQGETGRCPSNGAQAEALKRKGGREQATKSKRRKLVAKKRMYTLSLSLSGILFSYEKGGPAICDNMGGLQGCYTNWDNSNKGKLSNQFHIDSKRIKLIKTASKMVLTWAWRREDGRDVV